MAVVKNALLENKITCRMASNKFQVAVDEFKSATLGITCFLLGLSFGSKGLNLIEATHVFLVEPILNASEELQAIGRVHRIGQTKETFVHRFIVENTIEESIHNAISSDTTGRWKKKNIDFDQCMDLFSIKDI